MVGLTHQPVLLEEVCGILSPRPGGCYVDGTVGAGGHAAAILERSAPDGTLIGLDRDPESIEVARQRLARFGTRATLVHMDYRSFPDEMPDLRPDGILVDLGLSSIHLDDAERGFSFRLDGPLDMRFDRSSGETAAELLERIDVTELAGIIRGYGQERRAGAIARAIVRRRERTPLATTSQLRQAVIAATGRQPGGRIDPATRTFQALRIAVNRELEGLEAFIESAGGQLAGHGVLAVIAYHSLEDRSVKQTMARMMRPCTCPPGLPACACGAEEGSEFVMLTRRALTPGDEEKRANPRCRSARLRAVKRNERTTP